MKDLNWQNYPKRSLHDRDPWLPFPGMHPTRWAIDMKWGPNERIGYTHKWRYLGKPNEQVAWFVRQVLQNARYQLISGTEFVRNGVIAMGRSFGPRSGLSVNSWCRNKCLLVDPWAGYPNERIITYWADYYMRPLPVTYKGHRFVIYATGTAPTTGRLETYRNWLDVSNIKFSKQ